MVTNTRELLKSETENYDKQYRYSYTSGIRDLGAKIDFDYIPAPSHLIKFGGEFVNHLYRPEVERSRSLNNLDGKEEKSDKVNDASPNLYGNELSAYIEDDMTFGCLLPRTSGR